MRVHFPRISIADIRNLRNYWRLACSSLIPYIFQFPKFIDRHSGLMINFNMLQ